VSVRFCVFLAASLDGFIARPDDGLDWLEPFHGEEHGYQAFFDSVDALVLGRGTYDTVLAFPEWPYGPKRLIVCTRRPATPAHGEEIWNGTPRDLAAKLDREGVRKVYLDGGKLIRAFFREGLVHEMTISAIPIVLGDGIPLFERGLPERLLTLRETKSFASGLVQTRYEVGEAVAPEDTAVRVALWRALHVESDPPPHVLDDTVGLKLVAPPQDWRSRPDMSPFTRPFRASILARARFLEDTVAERAAAGVAQYVILGAGLDTFVQRRPEIASKMTVFEVDRPGPQAWKRRRLGELGFAASPRPRFVPVDFEKGDGWQKLAASGFDPRRPSVVASTGVSMYLTREANAATLRQVAALGPGSTFVMSFMLPIEMSDPAVRPGIERAAAGARANGTPFISFFTPPEMLALARECGFRDVKHVSAAALAERYFAGRTDGLRPPDNSEELLVATT
jgi:methyltransferase (TIGR00027 family)